MILEYVAHFPRVRCVMLVIRGTTARVTGPAKIVTRMLCGMPAWHISPILRLALTFHEMPPLPLE